MIAGNSDQEWLLINIDAHTDTRTDFQPHSGNPIFRLAKEFPSQLKIWQVGIHQAANSVETLNSLSPQQQKITYFPQCKDVAKEMEILRADGWISEKTNIFLSIDFDALEPQYGQGVSAINPQGLPLDFIYHFIKLLKDRNVNLRASGFYEYNPLFDHVSALGAKVIAQMILQLT
jgi:formiminoglutamase